MAQAFQTDTHICSGIPRTFDMGLSFGIGLAFSRSELFEAGTLSDLGWRLL